MSLFIIQVFIISALTLMIQSAPIERSTENVMTKEEKNQRELEKSLYCAARSLHNAVGQLRTASYTLPPLPKVNISSSTEAIMNKILHLFSYRCKNFTEAMTLKHQLQDHLFNADTAPDLSSGNAKILSTILTSLQTMANTFDDMEFNKDSRRCIKLTPAQYKIMYYVRYTNPLLVALNDDLEEWYLESSLYDYPDERKCN